LLGWLGSERKIAELEAIDKARLFITLLSLS
jgi:hypothetical protein